VSLIWAAILGLVQGVAEFLPISSTAHLKLVPGVFGVQGLPFLTDTNMATAFDIALHAGSAVAILIALWVDWRLLFDGVVRRERPALRFLGFLALTSIPGAIIGVLFDSKIEVFSSPERVVNGIATPSADTFHWAPLLVGVTLIAFGVLLWAVDHYTTRKQPLEKMNWLRALLIGLAQALALIPGVSRSGATMTAGRATGLSREAVAKYSFMAALPIIAGAALFGLRKVPLSTLVSPEWIIGFAAAFVSSWLLMRWMLAFVRNHSFSVFMWYRVAIGVGVIALFFIRG
jgi:undecaprenyl-diphosphatase